MGFATGKTVINPVSISKNKYSSSEDHFWVWIPERRNDTFAEEFTRSRLEL